MSKPLEYWVEHLTMESLPIMRRSRQVLTELARDIDNITPDQIAAQVYHDPFLVTNLLRRVVKMPRRGLSGEVTTVDHAVMMLGMTPFFSWARTLPLLEDTLRTHPPYLLKLMRIFARTYHAAYQAWDWAAQRKDINADEVFAGTLLQNRIVWAGWLRLPDEMQQIENLMQQQQLDFAKAFAIHNGFTLEEMHAALAHAWQLPELYADFSHGRNAVRALGIKLALEYGEITERGWWQPEVNALIEEVAGWLHQSVEHVTARANQNSIHAARHSVGWYPGAILPATFLPMLPGEWPVEADTAARPQVAATISVATKKSPAAPSQSATSGPPPSPRATTAAVAVQSGNNSSTTTANHVLHPEIVARIIADLKSHMDGSYDISQLMTRVLMAMHDGLAFDRVVFALLGADKTLKARFTRGVDEGAPLSRLNFNMQDRHLFGQMMHKMQGLWYHELTREKLQPYILPMLRVQIGKGEFMAMSIHVLEKPVGFFYADYGDDGHMDDNVYTGFKQLCQLAAEAMGNLSKKSKI